MLKSLKSNEKGIVFITVLMVIIVISVLTVSLISLNLNQTMLAENEVNRITLETLAQGGLVMAYANFMSDNPSPTNMIHYTETIGNVTYNIVANLYGPGLANTNTNMLNVYVTVVP